MEEERVFLSAHPLPHFYNHPKTGKGKYVEGTQEEMAAEMRRDGLEVVLLEEYPYPWPPPEAVIRATQLDLFGQKEHVDWHDPIDPDAPTRYLVVRGKTFPNRERLKSIGLKWNPYIKAWEIGYATKDGKPQIYDWDLYQIVKWHMDNGHLPGCRIEVHEEPPIDISFAFTGIGKPQKERAQKMMQLLEELGGKEKPVDEKAFMEEATRRSIEKPEKVLQRLLENGEICYLRPDLVMLTRQS